MKTIIHFTADWCQPCKRMKPVIDSYLDSHPSIGYVQVDIEKNPELFDKYNLLKEVLSVPTFFGMIDDELNSVHTGVGSEETLDKLFF